MNIEERNRLRTDAGLPLLDEKAEANRLATVERDAAFELYFRKHRSRFAYLWTDKGLSWLSRAGLWAQARRELRAEFETLR